MNFPRGTEIPLNDKRLKELHAHFYLAEILNEMTKKQRFQDFYFVIGTDVFRLFLGWAAIEGMRNVNIDLFYKRNFLK